MFVFDLLVGCLCGYIIAAKCGLDSWVVWLCLLIVVPVLNCLFLFVMFLFGWFV